MKSDAHRYSCQVTYTSPFGPTAICDHVPPHPGGDGSDSVWTGPIGTRFASSAWNMTRTSEPKRVQLSYTLPVNESTFIQGLSWSTSGAPAGTRARMSVVNPPGPNEPRIRPTPREVAVPLPIPAM